jgi:hypothetical protein
MAFGQQLIRQLATDEAGNACDKMMFGHFLVFTDGVN